MNRLIALDNLRHGVVELLVVAGAYWIMQFAADMFLAREKFFPFAIFLGTVPVLIGALNRPGNRPIESDLLTESLLPVSRKELVNTHWLLRVILPAVWLTLYFMVGWLLGFGDRIIETLGPEFPMHLLAMYLTATSIWFLNKADFMAHQGTKYGQLSWTLSVLLLLLGLLVPIVYLQVLWSLRDTQATSFLLIAAALLLVGLVQRVVCPRLMNWASFAPAPEHIRAPARAEKPPIVGFKGLILPDWRVMLLAAAFLTYVAPVADCHSDKGTCVEVLAHWFKADSVFQLTLASVILRFIQDLGFTEGVDLRALRTLPMSAQSMAGRYIFITSGLLWLVVCLVLWPVALYLGQIETATNLTAVSFLLISGSAILSPIYMVIRGLLGQWLVTVAAALCLGLVSNGFYDSYADGRVAGMVITSTLGGSALLFAWWVMTRLICESSSIYGKGKSSPLSS